MSRHLMAAVILLVTLTAVAASQAAPQRIRVDDKAMAAQIVTKVPPDYPPLARQARIQGLIILRAQIGKSGDVENLQLISGHPMLAPAAIEAVKQWKYKPFLLNGEPVEVETRITVNFTLSDKPPADGVAGDAPGGLPSAEKDGTEPSLPSDTPDPAVPRRVRVSSGVSQRLLVHKVAPQYPPDAREQRIQGVVVMKVNIDKDGNIYNVELISGHPMLAPAAIEAVKRWKYRPYLLNGTPVEVDTQVQINFTLAG
jgi:TonB family protein